MFKPEVHRKQEFRLVSERSQGHLPEFVDSLDAATLAQLNQRPIGDVPLLEPVLVSLLARVGIVSVGTYLSLARTPRDRMLLAAQTGISAGQLLSAACVMDFGRVSSLPSDAIILLRACGIHTVADLARQEPFDVVMAFLDMSKENLELPWPKADLVVQRWIVEARQLPEGLIFL